MINILWLVLTVFLFLAVRKVQKYKIFKFLPPMFLTSIVLIIILESFHVSFEDYNEYCSLLTLLLGPATISLAYPLYKNFYLLSKNKRAVFIGFFTASIIAIISAVTIGKLFHSDLSIVSSLIPKSVTAPIAIEISKIIGGIPELTACIVAITGLFGAVFGHRLLKIFHIKSDISKGIAIGATSHVLGTASCLEKHKEKQVVMATISLIVVGIITTLICVFFVHAS